MSTATSAQPDPEGIVSIIERFVTTTRSPVVLDPGEEPLSIYPGSFSISLHGRTPVLECWSETRNLVRRVRRVVEYRQGRLELEVERFGNKVGRLLLLDRANPVTDGAARQGMRLQYRERFRLSLLRQFPGWTLAELSTEADLHHSLSPAYPRALMRRGKAAFASIGASENGDPDRALSFGLIWLDYLRTRETRCTVEGLAIFVPEGSERATCHRVRHLNSDAAHFAVFVHTQEGMETAADLNDYANFSTRLDSFRQPLVLKQAAWQAAVEKLPLIDGVERRPRPDGSVSFAVRGLEFARLTKDGLKYGLEVRQSLTMDRQLQELTKLAEGLADRRKMGADRAHPLYQRRPEAWLEWQVRKNLQEIDATLDPEPVYVQAPHLAAGDRGVVDLLAIDGHNRLAVLELKTSQDIHLPLQALDYWMHVRWHLERGEFAANGYFAGREISAEPPRLCLVAPALDFHPTNETILKYFSPEVHAERIGVGIEWRQELKVIHRTPVRSLWPSKSFGKLDTPSGT